MTIGEVTARLGVPDSTIRYCEKMDPVDLRHRVSSRRRFHDRALVTRRFAKEIIYDSAQTALTPRPRWD